MTLPTVKLYKFACTGAEDQFLQKIESILSAASACPQRRKARALSPWRFDGASNEKQSWQQAHAPNTESTVYDAKASALHHESIHTLRKHGADEDAIETLTVHYRATEYFTPALPTHYVEGDRPDLRLTYGCF